MIHSTVDRIIACCYIITVIMFTTVLPVTAESIGPQPPTRVEQPGDAELGQTESISLDIIDRQLQLLDTSGIRNAIASLSDEMREELPDFDLREIAMGSGIEQFNLAQMLRRLLN
jgi:hypothetical protein